MLHVVGYIGTGIPGWIGRSTYEYNDNASKQALLSGYTEYRLACLLV